MRKKHRISFLTREEMLKLLAGPDTATLFGVRDLAILQVLYSTGLHVTELAALNLSDIDFINQQLLVGGKKGRMVSTTVTTLMIIENSFGLCPGQSLITKQCFSITTAND